MASTPFGRPDRFFAVSFRAGERGEHGFESFSWPSTVSPLIDDEILGLWQKTTTSREYEREVLAKFVDDQGAYFTSGELDAAVDDVPLIRPEDAKGLAVVGGLDWGFARDANALALIASARERGGREMAHRVVWLDEQYSMSYAKFIERVADAGRPGRFRFRKVVSELNGVGAMPTQELTRALGGVGRVEGVHTSTTTKEDGFGRIKTLVQAGRFRLPRHPVLLQQLSALEFEERDSGVMHISVPERAGHDDLAMALCLAASVVPTRPRRPMSIEAKPRGLVRR